jgi:hypothetical protein
LGYASEHVWIVSGALSGGKRQQLQSGLWQPQTMRHERQTMYGGVGKIHAEQTRAKGLQVCVYAQWTKWKEQQPLRALFFP